MANRTTPGRRANHEGTKPRLRSDGRWEVRIRWTDQGGKPRRSTLYGKSSAEVGRKAREVRRRLEDGKPGADSKITLADYVQTWLRTSLAASVTSRRRKPSTAGWYSSIANTHVTGSSLGALALDRVTAPHVEGWLTELHGSGLADSTIRSCFTVLRAILETARRDGLVAVNAASVVARPSVEHEEVRCLTADEVRALLDAAKRSRFEPLFRLLAATGLRRGEALALHWRDIDFDGRVLRVRGTLARVDGELVTTPPKSARSRRTIPLNDTAIRVLREVKARTASERLAAGTKWTRTPYVFVTEFGGPVEPRNAARALTAVIAKAKLGDGIGLHTLRHTAASLMLAQGSGLLEVSRHLGHASVQVTGDIYGHVAPDVSRRAVDALGIALGL